MNAKQLRDELDKYPDWCDIVFVDTTTEFAVNHVARNDSVVELRGYVCKRAGPLAAQLHPNGEKPC